MAGEPAPAQARITLFTTSTSMQVNVASRTNKLKFLLASKKVEFEEVDLTMEPERRAEMLAGSDGNIALPQVHVNGKFIGDTDTIQELEDCGELSAALRPAN